MATKTWLTSIVVVGMIGAGVLSAACSTDLSPPPAKAKQDDSTSDATQPKSAPSTSSAPVPSAPATAASTASSSSGGAANDNACAAQTEDACYACCSANHKAGSDASDEVEASCLCVPTRCATQCGSSSYCSDSDNAPDPKPGDACDLCIKKYENDDGTGECDKAVTAAAQQAGGDQAAFVACENNCP
jgi:hypothetical protein